MKVCELIEKLQQCPQNAPVGFECNDDWYSGEILECETIHYEDGSSAVVLRNE